MMDNTKELMQEYTMATMRIAELERMLRKALKIVNHSMDTHRSLLNYAREEGNKLDERGYRDEMVAEIGFEDTLERILNGDEESLDRTLSIYEDK